MGKSCVGNNKMTCNLEGVSFFGVCVCVELDGALYAHCMHIVSKVNSVDLYNCWSNFSRNDRNDK